MSNTLRGLLADEPDPNQLAYPADKHKALVRSDYHSGQFALPFVVWMTTIGTAEERCKTGSIRSGEGTFVGSPSIDLIQSART